eukprot:scaffold4603_cov175-Amphora_coffeaeformis.AAC.3
MRNVKDNDVGKYCGHGPPDVPYQKTVTLPKRRDRVGRWGYIIGVLRSPIPGALATTFVPFP